MTKLNEGSQRMLFEKFAPGIMTVCRRFTSTQQEAEDVMQESFIRIFSNLHHFRFEGSFEGWMRKIVTNTAIRYVKRHKTDFQEIKDENVVINEEAMANLNEEELLNMIQELPSGYRIVFNLFVIDGYNHDEIAELLNIEPVTSRTQLSKARKLLQKKIQLSVNTGKYERKTIR